MKFNPQAALQAGQAYISETGAYTITISKAYFKQSQTGNLYLEINGETQEGETLNFLNIYYKKANGELIHFNHNHIQSILGLLDIEELTKGQYNEALQLRGQEIGVFLQKNHFKGDDNIERSSLNLVLAYDSHSLQTYKERTEGKKAEMIYWHMKNTKDRYQDPKPKTPQGNQSKGKQALNEDIPF